METTLRQCLAGKQIIEYPTFVVGFQSHMAHLNLMIRDIEPPVSCLVTVDHEEEEKEKGVSLILPSGTGADDYLSPNKRRQFDELSSSAKKIRISHEHAHGNSGGSSSSGGSNEEVFDNAGEEMEEEGDETDEAFLKQLEDIENADISTLQKMIEEGQQ
jgi:hypothetical protein